MPAGLRLLRLQYREAGALHLHGLNFPVKIPFVALRYAIDKSFPEMCPGNPIRMGVRHRIFKFYSDVILQQPFG